MFIFACKELYGMNIEVHPLDSGDCGGYGCLCLAGQDAWMQCCGNDGRQGERGVAVVPAG